MIELRDPPGGGAVPLLLRGQRLVHAGAEHFQQLRVAGARSDEQMKAHGHQDRAYGNNVRPTRHPADCLDESPFP